MNKEEVVLVIIFAIIIFFICFWVALDGPKSKPPEVKPNIYITRTDHVRTFEGEEVWILEYTVNGMFQAPAFGSPEALAEYREYLGTIGEVYRKEEGNAEKDGGE
jgi:hypothetical protein